MTGTADEKDEAALLVDVVCENDELTVVFQYCHTGQKLHDDSRI